VAGLHHKEEEETNASVGEATSTAHPRARDSILARCGWVRHLPPVFGELPKLR
jgi:hypothetical protein